MNNPEKTLRDELAMSLSHDALSTFSSVEALKKFVGLDPNKIMTDEEMIELAMDANAKMRYMFADAMLKARYNEE